MTLSLLDISNGASRGHGKDAFPLDSGSRRRAALRQGAEADSESFSPHLIGQDSKFREALRAMRNLAKYGATVLIQGETGTGKELAARAIHYHTPGEQGPFVPVNCGAIPDELCENEFFGHAKGAYTGAQDSKAGILAAAEGGTLFLDEIECLSPRMQAILIRVLQDHVYRPLGSTRLVQGRFRIIAASNRCLAAMVRTGELRQDLFYRLSVLSVALPSLRQRACDIPILARHFIGKFARQYDMPEKTLSPEAVRLMACHPWPGNVRELENFIHRQFLMCEGDTLMFDESALAGEDFAPNAAPMAPSDAVPMPTGMSFREAKEAVIASFEQRYLSQLMQDCAGNVSLAARISGKERSALRRLLKKYGLLARDAD